ncbi:hypothetical protein SAMN04489712_1103 [Thermomonospora echinospora]|uniref:Uncharacterized protein n=1 Tax=Thermomonospora echinospora TaxID=1992 RepID=A0A1H6CHM3_9ACTN|nr:hypothetical protein [Thermomonospora echinospora]SEG72469.1 hypothetical protein SAMN04489712_1103 [Thermomonospora echinospora]
MRYAVSRPYIVPESLAELAGPTSGVVKLPAHLDWSEQHVYDLGDPAQAGLMYERVIREASSSRDLAAYLNAGMLDRLWNRLYLPPQVRRLWESRFPGLVRAA